MSDHQLSVEGLTVAFGGIAVVRDVSFRIEPGSSFGLVGESGSGKTIACRAVLGLLPATARAEGRVLLGSRSLLELRRRRMQELRGSQIAMVFQDPMSALNPVLRVGEAIAQVVRSHDRCNPRAARQRAVEMMSRVGIRDAERRAGSYPHEFSGGMRQRIVIAMALAGRPSLLLADEPTTALDVIVQASILRLIDRLRREEGMSLLLVSHDLSVVAGMCDRVGVMYAGQLVEEGLAREVLGRPLNPYTDALIESLPESTTSGPLPSIPGAPPDPRNLPHGCAFSPRCPLAADDCRAAPIPFLPAAPDRHSRCIHIELLPTMRLSDGLEPVATEGGASG